MEVSKHNNKYGEGKCDTISEETSVDWRGRPSHPHKHGGMRAATFVLGGDNAMLLGAAAVAAQTQPPGKLGDSNSFVGKHRIAAAISQLEAHMNSIQEELDELESSGESSLVCKEFMSRVESTPDPLLPWMNKGPTTTSDGWDRWFRGTEKNSQRRRWVSSSSSKCLNE